MARLAYSYSPIWRVLNRGAPYEPFDWQVEHLHSKVDAGFKRIILPCGRRSGKSTAVVPEVARDVVKPPVTIMGVEHSPIVYIIGPTAEASMRVWEPIWNAFVPPDSQSWTPALGFLYENHDKNRGVIFLKGGARIYRKTADDPRSLQGERVTLAIADEAHDLNEEAWENLMPGLSDSDGTLIAIGVARGKGRFRSYYHAGQGPDSDFYSASVPTTANPIYATMAAAEGISATAYLRKHFDPDLTDKEFARQYLAQWIEEDGTVFSDYERYFTGQGLLATGPHIMSLDLGKLHDFTVAYVGDVARQEFVARLRFNKIDYMDQVPQIAALYHKYGCRFIHMDVNGVGEAPAEMLRREHGCAVIPFKWTNESKQALISVMVREVQRGNITFMADDDVLKKEMALFEGVVSPGGTLRYDAPKGFYDDCVISAALLIQKMARNKSMVRNPIHKPYAKFSRASDAPSGWGTGRREAVSV